MKNRITFRNYSQGRQLSDAEIPASPLMRHLRTRLDELGFDYTCTVQIDDNRTDQLDATQIWVARSARGKWSRIHQLPVPFAAFLSDSPDPAIIALVDEFTESIRQSEGV
jgi:hypothetical protein